VARLKPDVDLEIANAEMRAIAGTLASEYPRSNTDTGALVIPLFDFMVGSVRRAVLILLGAVGLVLMVACANVANVQLARGFDRQRELAIRAALGAGRARIVRQLLVESGMLAVLACAGGFATARWLVNLVVALGPADVPRLHQVALDVRVLAVTATVAVVTAIAFGLVPALQLSRAEFVAGVREGGRATGPASRRRARNVLLASEVAVALVLLVGAGLLVRSFGRLLAIDPGFRQENVLALQVFAWERNNGPDRLTLYFERCLERLRALPDAVAVGAVSAMPFIEANINIQSVMLVANRPAPAAGEEPRVFVTVATPGYFQAMRVPLVRGRLLDDRDSRQAPPVALVSRSLARHYWPGTDPVGDHVTVRWEGRARTVEIVGVVVDVRHDGLDRPPREEVFLPFAQAPFGSMTFVVRTAGDPAGGIQAATDAIWAVDSLQTIYDTATVDRLVSASLKPRRFTLLMLGVSALIALSLTLAGVYGVMAVTTRQRTREIGVRVALGAGRRDIVRMVIGQGLQPVLAGAVIGLTGALAAGRVLEGLLFETTPFDPTTIAGVAVLLVAAAAAACYLPARRATRVDPLIALRAE
jgi:putative ABC transport system permease protein